MPEGAVKLRQSKARGQLRLLPKIQCPKPPLEKELIERIKYTAAKMGFYVFSGRLYVFGHQPPFLPVFGKGTPDLLFVNNKSKICGIEGKRDVGSEVRESQLIWQAKHPWIPVLTTHSFEAAVEFLKANRG